MLAAIHFMKYKIVYSRYNWIRSVEGRSERFGLERKRVSILSQIYICDVICGLRDAANLYLWRHLRFTGCRKSIFVTSFAVCGMPQIYICDAICSLWDAANLYLWRHLQFVGCRKSIFVTSFAVCGMRGAGCLPLWNIRFKTSNFLLD